MSQSWRFIAFEVRVISAKKEAFQALRVAEDMAWNPFTLRAKVVDKSIDCGGNTLVNQRIKLRQFCVVFCCQPKGLKLLEGVLPSFCGKALPEFIPAIPGLGSQTVLF